MLIPVRWKTFLRDFLIIQIGFALFGLSIALMIRSNLGTTPWAVLEVALSQLTAIRPGRMSIIVGMVVLLGSLILREKIGWGTLTNIMFIGLWEDMFLSYIPAVEDQLLLQSAMLFIAIFMMGFASAVYIGVDAGAGPRDSLMLAFHRNLRKGEAKAQAMRSAALRLLGDRRYRHPFYWAGFVVIGDAS